MGQQVRHVHIRGGGAEVRAHSNGHHSMNIVCGRHGTNTFFYFLGKLRRRQSTPSRPWLVVMSFGLMRRQQTASCDARRMHDVLNNLRLFNNSQLRVEPVAKRRVNANTTFIKESKAFHGLMDNRRLLCPRSCQLSSRHQSTRSRRKVPHLPPHSIALRRWEQAGKGSGWEGG